MSNHAEYTSKVDEYRILISAEIEQHEVLSKMLALIFHSVLSRVNLFRACQLGTRSHACPFQYLRVPVRRYCLFHSILRGRTTDIHDWIGGFIIAFSLSSFSPI